MNKNTHKAKRNTPHKSWRDRLLDAFLHKPKSLQELINLIRYATKKSIINPDALNMIEGVLSVSEKQVRDVMIPRPKMAIIPGHHTAKEALSIITNSGHSRFPVIDQKTEKIIGILLAKDLLKIITDDSKENWQIQRIMRAPKICTPKKTTQCLTRRISRASQSYGNCN